MIYEMFIKPQHFDAEFEEEFNLKQFEDYLKYKDVDYGRFMFEISDKVKHERMSSLFLGYIQCHKKKFVEMTFEF
jgi:hypothetical protein